MIPHDFYAPWSDEPKLHNRGEGRPYIEPSWQANAAGHQLPVLSTIGRGPKGNGIYVGNYQINDQEYGFDIYSDRTNEVIAHIGPIPTGQVTFSESQSDNPGDFKFTIFTNELVDGQVQRVPHDVTVPQGERGFSVYTMDGSGAVFVDEVARVPMNQIFKVDPPYIEATDTTPRVGDCVLWTAVVAGPEVQDYAALCAGLIVAIEQGETELGQADFAVIRKNSEILLLPANLDQYIENKTEEEVNRLLDLSYFVSVGGGIPENLAVKIDYAAPASISYRGLGGGFVAYQNYGDSVQITQIYGHVIFGVDDWKDFYYNDMPVHAYIPNTKMSRIFSINPSSGWRFIGDELAPIACNVLFDAFVDCNPIFHVGIGRTEGAATIEITAEDGISADDPRWDFFDPERVQEFLVSFEVSIYATEHAV